MPILYDSLQASARSSADPNLLATKQSQLEKAKEQLEQAQRDQQAALDKFSEAEQCMAKAQGEKQEADDLEEEATRELERAAAESAQIEQAFELARQLAMKDKEKKKLKEDQTEGEGTASVANSLVSWTQARQSQYEVQHFKERFGFDEATPVLWTNAARLAVTSPTTQQPRGIRNSNGSDCFFSSFLQMVAAVQGSFQFSRGAFERLCGRAPSPSPLIGTAPQSVENENDLHSWRSERSGLLRSFSPEASNRVCILAWFVSQELRPSTQSQAPTALVSHVRNEFGEVANGGFGQEDPVARAWDFRTRQNDSSEAALLFLQDYSRKGDVGVTGRAMQGGEQGESSMHGGIERMDMDVRRVCVWCV